MPWSLFSALSRSPFPYVRSSGFGGKRVSAVADQPSPLHTHTITQTLVTSAIGETLTGDPAYLPWLEPEMWGDDVDIEAR